MYLDGGFKRENVQPNASGKQGGKKYALAKFDFAAQSNSMNPNWAEENLQTIRTLMERSAVYRRALAPIMLFAGVMGVLAAVSGLLFHLDSMPAFGALWLSTAAIVVVEALLITRRQALKDHDPFWSPPTRRVTQALLPPLLAGLCIGGGLLIVCNYGVDLYASLIWVLFYGCALHSAGFFMPHGIKLFGWLFMAAACALFSVGMLQEIQFGIHEVYGHWVMGFFFGVLHLAYGAYLYLTEKGKNAA
jgi:hypothetical protein